MMEAERERHKAPRAQRDIGDEGHGSDRGGGPSVDRIGGEVLERRVENLVEGTTLQRASHSRTMVAIKDTYCSILLFILEICAVIGCGSLSQACLPNLKLV